VPVDLFGQPAPVTRAVAIAAKLEDRVVTIQSAIRGGSVTCSGTTFSEDEAVDISASGACRSRAGARIESSCDDMGCSTTGGARERWNGAWLLGLVVAAIAITLRGGKSSASRRP